MTEPDLFHYVAYKDGHIHSGPFSFKRASQIAKSKSLTVVVHINNHKKPVVVVQKPSKRPSIKKVLIARDGPWCYWCGGLMTSKGQYLETIDHVMPKSLGGTDDLENLVLACRHCNHLKTDKHPLVWLADIFSGRVSIRKPSASAIWNMTLEKIA